MRNITVLSLILFLCQCHPVAILSIYNLDTTNRLEIVMSKGVSLQGKITYVSKDDESFSGEYVFQSIKSGNPLMQPNSNKDLFKSENKSDIDFSKLYGFSENVHAVPVGTMILQGDKGTVIDIVFYTFLYDRGIASGVGKDNKGNVYRVYIGD